MVRLIDLHMIGVEPLLPFLEGSCVLVSVGSTRCPCVWELRLLILRDPIPAFSFRFWIFLNELLFDFFLVNLSLS